jgi:hypothetical protein
MAFRLVKTRRQVDLVEPSYVKCSKFSFTDTYSRSGTSLNSGTDKPDLEQPLEKCYRWLRGGPRRGNALRRPKHAATQLPPAGPPEAHRHFPKLSAKRLPPAGRTTAGPRRDFLPQAKSLTSRLWRFTA